MSKFVSVLALVVAGGALALAWNATSELEALREEVAMQGGGAPANDPLAPARTPSGGGRGATATAEEAAAARGVARTDLSEPGPLLRGLAVVPASPVAAAPPGLGALVERAVDERVDGALDEAVQKGVRRVLALRDKTPTLDTFADVLELQPAQSESVTRDIVEAQESITQVLKTPADDGTVFFDRLVDLMVEGHRKPGQDVGWKEFLQRVVSEPIPGANTTFGARIDGIKGDLKSALRRTMDDRQWSSFEAWELDATQIRDLPGSPYAEVQRRVTERLAADNSSRSR